MKKLLIFSAIASLFVALFFLGAVAQAATDGFEITTLSTRPEMVSGGDVLVQISVPRVFALEEVTAALNGQEITSVFRLQPATHSLLGLVSGLHLGKNLLVVQAIGPGHSQPTHKLKLTNYPITGPIFSGPHQSPFVCKTDKFNLPTTGGNLGSPLDLNCSAATRVDYVYRSTAGAFKPLLDLTARPPDLAQTTTIEGKTVFYIVRVETGTINRAIYQIAILHDPKTEPTPDLWTRPAGWNGRLVYPFGGGCMAGYHQGTSTGGVLNNLHLSRGYAVASATFNVPDINCNDVLNAETLMMVKEHFIEKFGVPKHTIGWGGSGGAISQYLIAESYPGLLDGIIPTMSFPDSTTQRIGVEDCLAVLRPYFNQTTLSWTDEQKRAVSGYPLWTSCTIALAARPDRLNPTECGPEIPVELRYHPVTNPTGARCSIYDGMVNIFGKDPVTGFARRPHDNVGVQYGLDALNKGVISKEQFLDLNKKIGGYDIDMNWIPERVVGDMQAIRIAYQTGRADSGAGGLAYTPIIDARPYYDLSGTGNIHDSVRSFVIRERLIMANGNADNQVILRATADIYTQLQGDFLRLMEEWLTNLEQDTSHHPLRVKMVRAKPAELVDACWTATGEKIAEPANYYDDGRCNTLYPPFGDPRIAAGAPLADDIFKCRLKRIDFSDYNVTFTNEEKARLREIFPGGVCNWSKPGLEQQLLEDTWLSFGPSEKNLYE